MKQLDPRAVWLFFISFILRWLAVFAFFGVWLMVAVIGKGWIKIGGVSFGFLGWQWIIILAFLALCFVWAKLTYHFYRYELAKDGFRKELGVIYKTYVTIPYGRIQNVDIYRGIWARVLGLSDLHIQTAGSSAGVTFGEGQLPALSREVAEQLRDELIHRTKDSKNQGL